MLTAPLLTATRLVGALVVLKAVDVAVRGPQALPGPVWLLVLAGWTGSGLALAAGRPALQRAAWAGVLVAGTALAVDAPLELRRQHLVLLLGVALAGLVSRDDDERRLLWRTQLSALYGVAALAKLNEGFLGGDVLAGAFSTGPLAVLPPPALLVPAGVALVLTEAALAVLLWLPRWRTAAVALAVALHGSALLVASADLLVGLRLVVFGGTAVAVCAACARRPTARRQDAAPVPSAQ